MRVAVGGALLEVARGPRVEGERVERLLGRVAARVLAHAGDDLVRDGRGVRGQRHDVVAAGVVGVVDDGDDREGGEQDREGDQHVGPRMDVGPPPPLLRALLVPQEHRPAG